MRSIIPIIPNELKELLPFGYQYVTGSPEKPYWPTFDDVRKTLSSPLRFPFSIFQQSQTSVRIVTNPPADPSAPGLLAFAAPVGKRGKLEVVQTGEFHWDATAQISDYEHNGRWYYSDVVASDGTIVRLEQFRIVRMREAVVENTYFERLRANREGEITKETKTELTVRYTEPLFELPEPDPSRYRRLLALLALFPIGGWVLVDINNRPERERTIRRRIEEWRKKTG
ncbi:MAG: hypothetical protein KatS3mg109_0780 [Pirellulaceae bacterium]|nr:MAG: hypothetical protein KatS3mg109_0780 [Pirellulaceae bacterium]